MIVIMKIKAKLNHKGAEVQGGGCPNPLLKVKPLGEVQYSEAKSERNGVRRKIG